MKIDRIVAHAINDTRGRPTIETTLTAGDLSATASVPSGKSTGEHEATERRDADGSVTSEIQNENSEIAKALIGHDFHSPDELDAFLIELDGTPNKSRLGANEILSVSIATQRLFAQQENTPLWRAVANRAGTTSSAPRLFVNVMNGGVHAGFKLPFQEYMLVVSGKISDALPVAQKAFARLGETLGDVPMGDEGGYAPTFDTLEKPFEILAELVKEFPGTTIAIDAAASQLFQDGAYYLLGKEYSTNELAETYANLAGRFGVKSIEDPFDEHATDDFVRLTAAVNGKILIVGDDFTCTNPALITDAIQKRAVSAVLIKPNQIGTVMETIMAVQETQAAGLKVIASHRSGETDDTFISDFAYGIGAYGIKAGGLGQPERLAKYSRLLAIEREAETV
ncbi:MAG: phosphopyruvate hydratase [bacterium]|nr:phosphopyruvate hydratase [bacterium]